MTHTELKGQIFVSKWFCGLVVITDVNHAFNTCQVRIFDKRGGYRTEEWDLQHFIWGIEQKEYVVINPVMYRDEAGKEYDVSRSILVAEYIRTGINHSIDVLLDWRLRLRELMQENNYPPEWYEMEMHAVDFLLSKHNNP